MKNPILTKQTIIEVSSELFNTGGYKSTSLSDITEATGFTKGAIYKHFENKEALENAAFDHITHMVQQRLREMILTKETAPDKIMAILDFFYTYIDKPFILGGCPLLNVAIEVDETESALRRKAMNLLDILRNSVENILLKGIKYEQIRNDLDVKSVASFIIASLEGGIMMSKLKGNDHDLKNVCKVLKEYMHQFKV
jgi:TetR/AcrR family transcriptional regulator, transcriptional repressor for nem operon